MTHSCDVVQPIVKTSWYLFVGLGLLLVVFSVWILYRSKRLRNKSFFVLMCGFIIAGNVMGAAAVRVELSIYNKISSMPHPLNDT